MDITLEPGTYVVAVSGGVDSVVLLDLLRTHPGLKLIVAHFDHGIRPNSSKDRQLVQSVARQHGLPFVYDSGSLGPDASEEAARDARYNFLHRVRAASGARAVITAHHQDDAIETAIMQIVRGTGRRGLSSLGSTFIVERPLLNVSKTQLRQHAAANGLKWNEDETNKDTKYLRNYIRHEIIPRLDDKQKKRLHDLVRKGRELNKEIDQILDITLHMQPSRTSLSRRWFARLPYSVSVEVMAHWLRRHNIRNFSRRQLEQVVVSAKTLSPGREIDLNKTHALQVTANLLALVTRDR